MVKPLEPGALRRRCELADSAFVTTDELPEFEDGLEQPRAIDAIRFGVGMRADGYHIFAMGSDGLGRHTTVRRLLEDQAARMPPPADRCYVFNFSDPRKPRCLTLPAGRALRFRDDMQHLIEDLRVGIPSAFESDQYRSRSHEIEAELDERQSKAMSVVGEKGQAQGIALLRTPSGFGFAPVSKDAVMEPQEFRSLPAAEQERLQKAIEALQDELATVIQEIPKWRREAQRKFRDLNREVTRSAVDSLIAEITAAYESLPEVRQYISEARNDILDHAEFFIQPKEGEPAAVPGLLLTMPEPGEAPLTRYRVNVLVEHSGRPAAPVIHEDNPTHGNLMGRIEYVARLGALFTEFTLIKAGAMHRANGGYLILDAHQLLSQPFAWEALKRALRSRELRVESPGEAYSLVSTVSLEPQPIPLDIKVVLVGERSLYYLLHAYDPEFRRLFKVLGDFEEDSERTPASEYRQARMIAMLTRREKLRPLNRAAVARTIEQAARLAGDAGRLSARIGSLADLLRETDYWAASAGHAIAEENDVARAIQERERSLGRVRERLQQEIVRGTVLIDSEGSRVGQINGLSVMEAGGFMFGSPHRITARVRLGGGKVVDIERETEMGGPIHSKGVLILSGFVAGRYLTRQPLAFSASLVLEQSYSGVEGDSASCAELCALLSALAGVPLAQSMSMTGSVNQHGDVQAIGGVNEKIEGFFDLCRERGLTGKQGVVIPASNVNHLMLREDVVKAVSEGLFQVFAVSSVDEAMEVMSGLPAGERGADGRYPPGSFNALVEERLVDYAGRAREAARRTPNGEGRRL